MSQSEWKRRGILCLVSGPSGSGKTTLCRRFSETDTDAVYAISATTRAPRGGEQDGIDYFFLSREKFEDRVRNGEFIEYAEVHGNLYGTLKSEVIARLEEGKDVLMDIDVQGAAHVRAQADPAIRDSLVDIFILPPNDEELLKRLSHRGTESQDQLDLRLRNAREEMKYWQDYQYSVISSDKESDFSTFRSIIDGERCRSTRMFK
ncbi:MAG: guanylate kinase [Verrucomicrobiales bacterium]|nr:guanylate kinase [Verrucomicrobiales bacterium]